MQDTEPDVVLCKIAIEITVRENDEKNQSDLRNFEYNFKYWRASKWLTREDLHQIKKVLYASLLESKHFKKLSLIFVEVPSKGEEAAELAIAYRPLRSIRHKDLIISLERRQNLFPIIFKVYASQFSHLCVEDSSVIATVESQNKNRNMESLRPLYLEVDSDDERYVEEEENEEDEQQPLLPPQKLSKRYVTTKLYDELYKYHQDLNSEPPTAQLQLPITFLPKLCRYQERTIAWLLKRETAAAETDTSLPSAFYVPLEAKDGQSGVFYMHRFMLYLQSKQPPTIRVPPGGILADEMGLGKTVEMLALIMLHSRPRFVISMPNFEVQLPAKRARLRQEVFCICNIKTGRNLTQCPRCRRWQHTNCVGEVSAEDRNDGYLCPSCWHESMLSGSLLPTGATFIVTPKAIKSQWLAEIQRHTRSLRVLVYGGIANRGNWISPYRLATDYDIVLTDYNVLRSEFYHTSDNIAERVTRNKPRFMRVHTPLLMLEWWRVCLDEAQMIESNTSHIAALVHRLPAVNRWAVTGTPINRSIDDLHPLLRFIGFDEAAEPLPVWNNLVHDFVLHQNNDNDTQQRRFHLIGVLQQCMWRTCKSKVTDELLIPPQDEQVHYIRLSNLEKLFYMEQHADCAEKFHATLNKYIQRGYTISPAIMKLILQPLMRIRQCCNIPVINELNKNTATGHTQKQHFMQPKELHTHLKSTNELDCKNELRSMASSYNGMAGIYILRKEYAEAIKHYQFVLQLARNYSDINITVDRLLQIHALHNMLQAYYISPEQYKKLPASTLENYEQQLDKLEWHYLESYAAKLVSTDTAVQLAKQAMVQCFEIKTKTKTTNNSDIEKESFEKDPTVETDSTNLIEFISELLEILDIEQEELLIKRMFEECFAKFPDNTRIEQIQSTRTALLTLSLWWDKVNATKQSLSEEFEDLRFFTDNIRVRNQVNAANWSRMMEFVRSVYDCHLSGIREKKPKDADAKKADYKAEQKSKKLCKLCIIQNLLNIYECLLWNKVIDEKTNLSEGLEVPSMEFYLIKVIFTFMKMKHKFYKLTERIDKYSESLEYMQNWCKKLIKFWIEIEYTVKAYDELDMCKMRISLTKDDDDKSIYRISEYELDATFVDNQMNFYEAQRKFTVKLARLKYLMHLESDADKGPCPICRSENETYAVLECGHYICYACLKQIRHYNKQVQDLICPICRNKQNSRKIYYVMRSTEETLAVMPQLVGNYSSKIAHIVRLILRLQAEHSEQKKELPKILVFSQWQPILDAISIALWENKIVHRLRWSPETIEEFKSPNLGVTCLLMLLSRGSKGLNLIEATHVFLVEPILNPGEELQAVGRVHRFGQTKPTTVHRFIVSNTIEENVFNVVTRGKEAESNWEFNKISLESLRDLFKLENDLVEDFQVD